VIEVRYLRKMINGVPVLTTPAEIGYAPSCWQRRRTGSSGPGREGSCSLRWMRKNNVTLTNDQVAGFLSIVPARRVSDQLPLEP